MTEPLYDKERDEKMGPWIGDRSVKYLRKIFDEAADACDGDYKEKVAAGMLACYDSGFRTGRYTAPLPECGTSTQSALALDEVASLEWHFGKEGHSSDGPAMQSLKVIRAALTAPVSASGRRDD